MPSFVTKAIARRSGLTGRSGRGRIFWQGLSESQCTGSLINGTPAIDLVNNVIAADAAAIALGWTPVILSYVQNGVSLPTAAIYVIAEWLLTDFFTDTRRSRKLGVGA